MDERIGNITRSGSVWEFLVNGRDRRTAFVVIGLVVLVALAVIVVAAVIAESMGADGIVWMIVDLIVGLAAIVGVLGVLRSGRWARYAVRLDTAGRTVEAEDRRRRVTLWRQPFDPAKLYLAQHRIQVGYASSLAAALCYGDPPQDHVEDEGPLPHKTVLAVGDRKTLETLQRRLSAS